MSKPLDTIATIKRMRTAFSGATFSSKDDVANWMRERADELEKEGWPATNIFYILKCVVVPPPRINKHKAKIK